VLVIPGEHFRSYSRDSKTSKPTDLYTNYEILIVGTYLIDQKSQVQEATNLEIVSVCSGALIKIKILACVFKQEGLGTVKITLQHKQIHVPQVYRNKTKICDLLSENLTSLHQRCNRVIIADQDDPVTRIPIRVRPGFDPDVTRIK